MSDRDSTELRKGLISAVIASLSGNLAASLLMGVAVVVLPKFVSMDTYGTWQAYVLYATYMGYLTFGLAEGYYVRHSGETVEDINKTEVTGQLLITISLLLVVLVPSALVLWKLAVARTFVVVGWAMLTTLLYVPRVYLCYVFQSVNQMWVFARAFIIERATFLILALVGTFILHVDAWMLLSCDAIGRCLGLLFTLYQAKKPLLGRIHRNELPRSNITETFKAGIPLNLAALAAVLITAVPRFAVERAESVDVFGQVAFVFSIVAMFQTVASAISNAILPSLRRAGPSEYAQLYRKSSQYLTVLMIVCTPLVGLLVVFVRWWLPSLDMLPALVLCMFPFVYFESRSRIISTPFLQAIREEKYIVVANLISLLVSLVSVTYGILHDWPISVITAMIPVAVAVRAVMLAVRTDQRFKQRTLRQMLSESILAICMASIGLYPGWRQLWLAFAVVWLLLLLVYVRRAVIRHVVPKVR